VKTQFSEVWDITLNGSETRVTPSCYSFPPL